MASKLDRDALRARAFPVVEQFITERDCMLYALTLGLGRNPLDPDCLRFVYERDLETLPTMALVLGHPGDWMDDPAAGIMRSRIVHGSQRLTVHSPLQAGRLVHGLNRIAEVFDKGAERGAVLVMERSLRDAGSGRLLATMQSEIFCRADGGFGGPAGPSHVFREVPARDPDAVVDVPTTVDAALFYRLNGDRNALHADPEAARSAGFDRPILHGLCTFGIAAVEAQRLLGGLTSIRTLSIEARFTRPVLPGETLAVELWREQDSVAFRARTSRADVVLDRGRACPVAASE